MSEATIDYDRVAEIYDRYVTATYDVAFFLEEAKRANGPVLELTAGTGRLSLPLLEAGARLTCVDVSAGLLGVLNRKVQERGLHAEVICADVCELELPTAFPLAIVPFQAFMEIVGDERQRAALDRIFACLAPGGRLILTLHNPAVRRRQVDGTLRLVGSFPTPEGTLLVSGFEQGGRPVVERLQVFEHFDADGLLTWKRLLPMRFALIEREELESMALAAGFRVVALYGDYARSPFDPVASAVMIWELERPLGRRLES